MTIIETLFTGFRFPEGARWHDELLWFSDMHTGQVFRADPDSGSLTEIATVPDQPSGLGWLSDGSLLISCMLERKVVRLRADGGLDDYADLSALTDAPTNDLVVDSADRVYLGGFGYDLYNDAPQRPGPIFRIDADRSVHCVETGMVFPNGSVILPGTATLVVAETWGARLTAFDIADNGDLTNKRIWAELPAGSTPDGVCVDAAGGVWVSSIATGQFLRVEAGGQVTDVIALDDGRCATDCVTDSAGTTLFLLTANSWQPGDTTGRLGRIETVRLG
ncbi:SMP-30/gluconolactonase/LRE family protein [Nocardia sp. NPDC058176]|uniref:SMP-30/gluconolactonase/LRE family protein n=1 Tax=Nocardia sp. NPDC058176 TaxID=3346368 RepID=UPI0036D871AB